MSGLCRPYTFGCAAYVRSAQYDNGKSEARRRGQDKEREENLKEHTQTCMTECCHSATA